MGLLRYYGLGTQPFSILSVGLLFRLDGLADISACDIPARANAFDGLYLKEDTWYLSLLELSLLYF